MSSLKKKKNTHTKHTIIFFYFWWKNVIWRFLLFGVNVVEMFN